MPNVFTKKIRFSVPPARLFSFFAASEARARTTGYPAKGDAIPGSAYSSGSGSSCGKTLYVEKDRLIIQTWRASDWKKDDKDSILVLSFQASASGTELQITLTGLPEGAISGVKDLWSSRCWKPIKAFIKMEQRAAAPRKPRGRPRKNPVAPPQTAPRGRGRPSKAAESAGTPPARNIKGKADSRKAAGMTAGRRVRPAGKKTPVKTRPATGEVNGKKTKTVPKARASRPGRKKAR